MIETILFSLIVIISSLFIIIIYPKNTNKGILAVLLWQLGWLLFSTINPLELKFPPRNSIFFIILCNLSFILGFIQNKTQLIRNSNDQRLNIEENIKIIAPISIILIMIYIILSLKAIVMMQNVPIYEYRRMIYQNPEELFFIKQGLPIFQFLIEGLTLLLTIKGFYLLLFKKRKKIFMTVIIISILSSIVFLGRYQLYRVALLFIFYFLLFEKNKNKKLMAMIIFLFFVILLFSFSLFRGHGVYGITEIFIKHILGYHTFGYHLFEKYLIDIEFFDKHSWFGLASLGSFGYLISKPFSFFGFETYLQSLQFTSQDVFINLGIVDWKNIAHIEILANAFYTGFRELFTDFNYFSVILFYPIGILSRYCYKRFLLNDYIGIQCIMLIMFLILFFGMKNPFNRHEIIIPVIYYIFYLYKTRPNFRYV